MAVWYRNEGIYASRYTRNLRWDTPKNIGDIALPGSYYYPRISMNSVGDAVAVWRGNDYEEIRSNRFSITQGWSTAETIDHAAECFLSAPQIAVDNNGNAMAIWNRDCGNLNDGIWCSRYLMGLGWGATSLISADSDVSNLSRQIAVDAIGRILVVWLTTEENGYSIWSNRFR